MAPRRQRAAALAAALVLAMAAGAEAGLFGGKQTPPAPAGSAAAEKRKGAAGDPVMQSDLGLVQIAGHFLFDYLKVAVACAAVPACACAYAGPVPPSHFHVRAALLRCAWRGVLYHGATRTRLCMPRSVRRRKAACAACAQHWASRSSCSSLFTPARSPGPTPRCWTGLQVLHQAAHGLQAGRGPDRLDALYLVQHDLLHPRLPWSICLLCQYAYMHARTHAQTLPHTHPHSHTHVYMHTVRDRLHVRAKKCDAGSGAVDMRYRAGARAGSPRMRRRLPALHGPFFSFLNPEP